MRTIKFRGKSLENGEWLYGDLIHYEWESEPPYPYIQTGMERNEHGIMQTCGGRVNPSTVGQFTGLADNNGKEIYEGDIEETFIGELKVVWSNYDGEAGYRLQDGGGSLYSIDGMEMEVVGDIHDNPELLTE